MRVGCDGIGYFYDPSPNDTERERGVTRLMREHREYRSKRSTESNTGD